MKRAAPSIACVLVTAYATVATMREALRRGAQDFLPKPFTPDELVDVVNQTLIRRRLCLDDGVGSGEERGLRKGLGQLMDKDIRPVILEAIKDLNHLGDGLDSLAGPQETARQAAKKLEGLLARLEKLSGE